LRLDIQLLTNAASVVVTAGVLIALTTVKPATDPRTIRPPVPAHKRERPPREAARAPEFGGSPTRARTRDLRIRGGVGRSFFNNFGARDE